MLPAGRPGPSGRRSGHRRCRWRPVQPHLYPLPRLPPGRTGGRGPGSGRSRRRTDHRAVDADNAGEDEQGGDGQRIHGRSLACEFGPTGARCPKGHTDRHERRFSRRCPPAVSQLPAYRPGKGAAQAEAEHGITDAIKLASNENPMRRSPRSSTRSWRRRWR